MSLKLQVLQTGEKEWAARVTLTSPKMDAWVYAKTKEMALKKLDRMLAKLEMSLYNKTHRVLACRAMIFRSLP